MAVISPNRVASKPYRWSKILAPDGCVCAFLAKFASSKIQICQLKTSSGFF